jgi:hypothetical protein
MASIRSRTAIASGRCERNRAAGDHVRHNILASSKALRNREISHRDHSVIPDSKLARTGSVLVDDGVAFRSSIN